MGAKIRLLGKLKKSVGRGTKVLLKKGWKTGKRAAKTAAIKGGKMALAHANMAANTAIRGAGAAASATAGNPAPMIGAEALIRGKDYLMSQGAKRFAKGSGKAQVSYTKPKKVKFTPRSKKNIGIAVQNHGYAAISRLHHQKEPRGFKTPSADYLNRFTDKFGHTMNRNQYFNHRRPRMTKHYNVAPTTTS